MSHSAQKKVRRQEQNRYRRSLRKCTLTCVSVIQCEQRASDGCMGNWAKLFHVSILARSPVISQAPFHVSLQRYRLTAYFDLSDPCLNNDCSANCPADRFSQIEPFLDKQMREFQQI